ncbi:UV radiation resistance-associated protein-like [Rhopilema esculentum]|uniref:UV radiation resistance-associated protein-like n=1 Tax=Rhopilema esculentum TaxID=499914 RepID=UPI0031DABAA0
MEGELMLRPQLSKTELLKLESQQRHLRHLSCVFGRNIDPSLLPVLKAGSKPGLLHLYFTLHDADDKTVLYQSEVIKNSLNPSWNEFDPSVFPEKAGTASSIFILRIWASRVDSYQTIIRLHVDLGGLMSVGDQLKQGGSAKEPNTVIFKMFGQYFTYTAGCFKALTIDPDKDTSKLMFLKVDQDAVLWAYKKSSLLRVHCMLKAMHETKQQVKKARCFIEGNLKRQKERWCKLSERESLHGQINRLTEELVNMKGSLERESNSAKQRKRRLTKKEKELNSRQFDLEQYVSSMKISHSSHIVNRDTLVKVNAQLNYRRKQLAAELSYIFPIFEIPAKDYLKKEYAITGVRLPVSDALTGEADEMLSVALGNTCHLVTMMAKFMELPLRYPMRPMGSRSAILDLVKDKLVDREREFPLYLKGKEKYQFHYGVYLLNKDIAQLRYHCGLGTSDLRQTLYNLRHLFENKFGVRIVVKPDTETLQQRISLIPHGRTLSETDEPDSGVAVNSPVAKRDDSRSSERPRSFHSVEMNDYEALHKSKSQGSLQNQGGNSGLPAPSNRTQMHRLISFKSKKGPSRARSLPDRESPTSSNLLLQVPFEEMVQGKVENVRRNTLQDIPSGNYENGFQKLPEKGLSSDVINSQYGDFVMDSGKIKTGRVAPKFEQDDCTDKFCLECLRNGDKCIDCTHRNHDPVGVEDVQFDESKLPDTAGLYSRQDSDILLIPGPFDDHDKIESIEDTKCANAI